MRISKKTYALLAVVASLAITGFLASFMQALLHWTQNGDRGYMVVFVLCWTFGAVVLYKPLKLMIGLLEEPADGG